MSWDDTKFDAVDPNNSGPTEKVSASEWNTMVARIKRSINSLTEKVSPVGADVLIIEDSADSFSSKKVLMSTVLGAGSGVVWLPSDAAYIPVTNPATLVEELGSTVYAGHSHLAYDDTTAESAVWRVPVPDYDGGNIIVTAYSKVATTPSGAVTLQYDILTIGISNSEAFDSAVTVDTGVNISHSLNTTELNTDTVIASATIDPANVSAYDLLVIEIKRDVGDTLVGDGELLGILIEYTRV